MKTAELREKYLAFFESKGCKRIPSSSLIPDDPSMLLTSAGMVQFKPYFLQQKQLEAPYVGTTTVQKCVRTTDIDIIGTTGRHLSFFEMMGNFSFGAYFKEEMCAWAYEFAIDVLGFPKEKLHFTVYEDDDETTGIWESLGVEKSHITRLGKEDNFWVAGATGPCGPCSELYYDQGPEFGCGSPACAPGCSCDRFLEFWNCVFTQYDMQEDGSLVDLPKKNIDTGLGLERTAAILQKVQSNYETDMLRGLIAVGERLSGTRYTNSFDYGGSGSVAYAKEQLAADLSLRILADHSRAVTFMIGDGILPSNEGRGYVLRRLMRRAMRHGLLLGIEPPFLGEFIAAVMREMGAIYPEIVENRSLIERIAHSEEERFAQTLKHGQGYLAERLHALSEGAVLDGAVAFELHDRFGFPIDLTVEIAAEQGVAVDREGFARFMERQRTRAREHTKGDAWVVGGKVYEQLQQDSGLSVFLGYDCTEAAAKVLALIVDGQSVEEARDGQAAELILDRTPFYAEKGGQTGDVGTIIWPSSPVDSIAAGGGAGSSSAGSSSAGAGNPNSASALSPSSESRCGGEAPRGVFTVRETKPQADGIIVHYGHIDGTIQVGSVVIASVNNARRKSIERNHTATHLLHSALREVLGEHVKQAGSLVEPHRLRFDFTHFEQPSPVQLSEVERLVNSYIMEDSAVKARETSLSEARASGVTALFGEKYGERVRVLDAGPHSRELCGGTHVAHTSQIGLFKILSESSVGANLRRIEAVTAQDALERYRSAEAELAHAAALLKATPSEVSSRLEAQLGRLHELETELIHLKKADTAEELAAHVKAALKVGKDAREAYQLLIVRHDGLSGGALREAADYLRQKLGEASAVVVASKGESGSASILAAATNKAVEAGFNAGALIKELAFFIGGKGGGKPAMAQAGGKNAEGIDAALARARELLVR